MTVCSECGEPGCTSKHGSRHYSFAPSLAEIAAAMQAIREKNYLDRKVYGTGNYNPSGAIREYVGMRQGDKYRFEAR